MATDHGNSAEIAAWNGSLGRTWADWQAAFDAVLEPIGALTLARADVRSGERVIDVGCEAGATTVELGKLVGPSGSVIGVDVSSPLLARAKERLPSGLPVTFVEADATAHVGAGTGRRTGSCCGKATRDIVIDCNLRFYTTDALTLPAFRGKALHALVLRAMLAHARAHGDRHAYTLARVDRTDVYKGLFQLGWRECERVIHFLPRGRTKAWFLWRRGNLEPLFRPA